MGEAGERARMLSHALVPGGARGRVGGRRRHDLGEQGRKRDRERVHARYPSGVDLGLGRLGFGRRGGFGEGQERKQGGGGEHRRSVAAAPTQEHR
ncbi:MAG: hypothetical protein A2138_24650 [Deltaproteobacteria bacterium RBG_16_71_12]|nr:MAG: hypothetical protein A2138_24650 [Deltaproteobacteria bacterium RBG_16_71_12]